MAANQQRTSAASFDDVPGTLPTAAVPDNVDLQDVVTRAIDMLNNCKADSFTENVIWRDFVAFTGTYRTFHSVDQVLRIFRQLSVSKNRSSIHFAKREPRITRVLDDSAWVDVDFEFSTEEGSLVALCSGTVSVAFGQDGALRAWMIRTWLEAFDGCGNPDVLQPVQGNAQRHEMNGSFNGNSKPYDAIIIGGGQSGLAIAGRLEALKVRYILLESNAEIGDIWKHRYESLKWHTTKEYGELPFDRTYAEEDPLFVPTKRIGEGHRTWAAKFGIRARTDSLVEFASWNDADSIWTVTVRGSMENASYKGRNLVLSVGAGSASPVVPTWAEPQRIRSSNFTGTIVHSKDYSSSLPWAEKRGIVVGTANTGHDVAEDMVLAGMQTTLMQRNPTFIFPVEWLRDAQLLSYNPSTSTERSDRETFTYPMKIYRELTNRNVHRAIEEHQARFDALERAGFRLERYGDICDNLYARFGGHYVDTGASTRIVNGEIRVETRHIEELTSNGLLLEDGSELGADLIVLCTGFDHDFRLQAKSIIGDIADIMDDYWGIDREGEIRGHAKIAGHPHLYYHGGDVRMGRWFSRFIALRIQAETLGHHLDICQLE